MSSPAYGEQKTVGICLNGTNDTHPRTSHDRQTISNERFSVRGCRKSFCNRLGALGLLQVRNGCAVTTVRCCFIAGMALRCREPPLAAMSGRDLYSRTVLASQNAILHQTAAVGNRPWSRMFTGAQEHRGPNAGLQRACARRNASPRERHDGKPGNRWRTRHCRVLCDYG
jgi:hypothetical protein